MTAPTSADNRATYRAAFFMVSGSAIRRKFLTAVGKFGHPCRGGTRGTRRNLPLPWARIVTRSLVSPWFLSLSVTAGNRSQGKPPVDIVDVLPQPLHRKDAPEL